VKIIIDNYNLELGHRDLIEDVICGPRICMELWRVTTMNFRIAGDASAVWNMQ
jgi:hypothetical protein